MDDGLTVRGVLERLFPIRERPYPAWPVVPRSSRASDNPYDRPPLLPFDVFAAAASLLELSGAYHHISALIDGPDGEGSKPHTEAAHRDVAKRQLTVTRDAIEVCRREAEEWRKDIGGTTDEEIRKALTDRLTSLKALRSLWRKVFVENAQKPVFARQDANDEPPGWWEAAHRLLMIADEASAGVGFTPIFDAENEATGSLMPWFEAFAYSETLDEDVDADDVFGMLSLASANPDSACVIPKARTTAVGCTMRSVSHHLALLPPQGVARGIWHAPLPGRMLTDETELNVLLVPFPYSVSPNAFEGVATRAHLGRNWGFFHLRQDWLPPPDDELRHRQFVDELHRMLLELRAAACAGKKARSIDAIVFPELALNGRAYGELSLRLKASMPELELLIAGVSEDDRGRTGNFVAVTSFQKQDPHWRLKSKEPHRQQVFREKHHRWKLDEHQIETYGLEGVLNPRISWWEDIDLLSRRIDFTTFRRRSVLAAMICEDLARVDPCQELLRAVGPNLIVALLMDAAQLPQRWSARYATVLAEDPGSSVLTLSSRALIARQQATNRARGGRYADSHSIGLWRDDHGRLVTLDCPPHAQAVWLKLWSSPVTDTTIDGRIDSLGKTWTYAEHAPLPLPDASARYPTVLG